MISFAVTPGVAASMLDREQQPSTRRQTCATRSHARRRSPTAPADLARASSGLLRGRVGQHGGRGRDAGGVAVGVGSDDHVLCCGLLDRLASGVRVNTRRSVAELAGCAKQHLDTYCDPAGVFAFSTYDRLYGPAHVLTPLDCLAANLLSLRLGWRQVTPLFQQIESPAVRLRLAMQQVLDATNTETSVFEEKAGDTELAVELLVDAIKATAEVKGWTGVTVTKVLHRLRPRLVPVVDSQVMAFYRVRKWTDAVLAVHQDAVDNYDLLKQLAAGRQTPDGRPFSVLRVLDIVVWHHLWLARGA
jgi:hypothetical protein